MSVPQIVVVVIFTKASPGPAVGMGFCVNSIFPGRRNTAAFMARMVSLYEFPHRECPTDERAAIDRALPARAHWAVSP
jgi:hypothetical protein